MFLTFDQGPAQTLPFPAATHQAQRPRGRRITPEARDRIVFSRPSPTIFVFQRLADIAQLADFWIRSVLAREQAPGSSWLGCSRLCPSASTRSGCRGQGPAGATNISILTVSAAAIRSASYTPPRQRAQSSSERRRYSQPRASRSALSDVRQCRMRNMAEPYLSTASNGFLIWHGACLVIRKASRTKENPVP